MKKHIGFLLLSPLVTLGLADAGASTEHETVVSEAPQFTSEDQRLQAGIAAVEGLRYDEAFGLLEPLAKTGEAEAQYFVGMLYMFGWGVQHDIGIAESWFKKAFDQWLLAAKTGNAEAMIDVALMYDVGLGTKRDEGVALEWLKKAVEQGSVRAMGHMGDMYLEGHGVNQDHEEAVRWYTQAADQGDEYARYMLDRLDRGQARLIPGR